MNDNAERLFGEIATDCIYVIIDDGALRAEHRGRGIDKYFDYEKGETVGFTDFMQSCADVAETSNGYYDIESDEYEKTYTVTFYTYESNDAGELTDEVSEIGIIGFRLAYFNADIDIHQIAVDRGIVER